MHTLALIVATLITAACSVAPQTTYRLERITSDGNVYVDDYNLTAEDCRDARRPGTTCVVER
ncbi:hypothetical protein BES08_07025 [Novosphingobium resinovorum]|uniref:Uncharacterized protein n=1 Tax=Novosphingobium resinovorum TaxID=158500 RepID=A0A1D8A2Z8_9SPHN|nr:hypothetical protein BES08_07025 [Novosphingobium resinovorum]